MDHLQQMAPAVLLLMDAWGRLHRASAPMASGWRSSVLRRISCPGRRTDAVDALLAGPPISSSSLRVISSFEIARKAGPGAFPSAAPAERTGSTLRGATL